MQLRGLPLHNFRCYENLALQLPDGLNVFAGEDASAKIALLEGVFLLVATSPRPSTDRNLVRWSVPSRHISGRFLLADGRALED